jgi:hypothetical protein
MIECPKCGHRFPESLAKRSSFEMFHALRDEYARAQGIGMVEAKDTLCVMFGVSLEYDDDFQTPKWTGRFCELWGRKFFRKSTLEYTKEEMHTLIMFSEEAIHGGNP